MSGGLRWLTIEEVFVIHERQIAEFGGAAGRRDDGAVRSALARPQNLAAYDQNADLAALAAVLAHGLARNHGFVDGNKRTALAAAAVFLRLNGSRLHGETGDVVRAFLDLAAGGTDETAFASWIGGRLMSSPPQDN
ncbi:MAG: type II toxin-antitoxin system death-on-curing family toxin [Rhodobacteraceae bacterium]|nr:type II toxin-antitoxin system death-on-curing family toxin [Paracoccaceae bacterium]